MKKTLTILIIVAIIAVVNNTIYAGYTSASSVFILETLETNYNGQFQQSGSYDYSYYNSSTDSLILANRMNDTVTRGNPFGAINLLTGDGNNNPDQAWTSASAIASARVVDTDSDTDQTFGYSVPGGNVNWIKGTDTVPVEIDLTGQWEWLYTKGSNTVSSNNGNGPDNMITYEITGLNNGYAKTWLLFWDDLQGENTGLYSDLVVEITANPVPVPGAFLLGGIGVACVGWMKRRKSL